MDQVTASGTSVARLRRLMISWFEARGYYHDRSAVSFNRYLAQTITAISGTPRSDLTWGLDELISGACYAMGGRSSLLRKSSVQAMAEAITVAEDWSQVSPGRHLALGDDALRTEDGYLLILEWPHLVLEGGGGMLMEDGYYLEV